MLALLSYIKIRRIILSLRIKDLRLIIYNINKYVLILIFISIVKNDIKVLYYIFREVHLINDLKAYILLDNNIIKLEKIILDIN